MVTIKWHYGKEEWLDNLGQSKKIPESKISAISRDIDEGTVKLRQKARELNVAPSTLHDRIKKYKYQKSIHNSTFFNPSEKTEKKDLIVKKTKSNTKQLKRPNIKKQQKQEKQKKQKYRCKDINVIFLRSKNTYIPQEILNTIHWLLTGKVIRLSRIKLIDRIIELFQEYKKKGISISIHVIQFIYYSIIQKEIKKEQKITNGEIISMLKKQRKISYINRG